MTTRAVSTLLPLVLLLASARADSRSAAREEGQTIDGEHPGSGTGGAVAAAPRDPALGPATDEPGEAGSWLAGEEPGGALAPAYPTAARRSRRPGAAELGAGFSLRGIFVPSWLLGMFLDASTPLRSAALGAELVRRKGNFDLVASINFGFYSPEDGNYLGKGNAPGEDTDYVQFRRLNLLALDVSFIWHHPFTSWLSLVYGGGVGLGIVLGDIYRISSSGCTAENVGDRSRCNPANAGGNLALWNEDRNRWLESRRCPAGQTGDDPLQPCLFREDDVWPVVPVIHLLLGLSFKVDDKFQIRVDGGWHDAFYFGAAGHYFFY